MRGPPQISGLTDLSFKAEFFPVLRHGDGIAPREAAVAEGAGAAVGQLVGAVHAEIPQGIGADDPRDLLRGAAAGDEMLPGVDVGTKIAGVEEGGRGHPHVDLGGPRLPQQANDAGGGGAPDNGVVDEDHPLAPHGGGDGVELDAHLVRPVFLPGGDEGAGDILVLDKADAVGDAGLPGVADGGVNARVGLQTYF